MFNYKGEASTAPVLIPQSKAGKQELRIHNDCDGTPTCAVEIQVTQTEAGGSERYIEVHMTRDEAKFLIRQLKRGIKK